GLAEPFTTVGALADRAFGKVDIGVGVVNGWDLTSDNNNAKTIIGKLGFNFGDPFSIFISGLHGPEQPDGATPTSRSVSGNNRDSLDGVVTLKVIPKTT